MNQGIHEMILPWCGYIPLWSVLSWYSLYLYYSVPTSQQQFRDDKLWTRYCIKSNTNVRAKSIRLDWILFNTSSTQFPILLYIILRQRSYTSHNLSGSNRGLGATKKSICLNATNPTSTYVQRVLDWIEFFLIPRRLNFPFYYTYRNTATIQYSSHNTKQQSCGKRTCLCPTQELRCRFHLQRFRTPAVYPSTARYKISPLTLYKSPPT